jgi:hypothetical protein
LYLLFSEVDGCVVHLVERQPPRATRSNGQSKSDKDGCITPKKIQMPTNKSLKIPMKSLKKLMIAK